MNRLAMFLVFMFVGAFAAAGVQEKEMPSMANMGMQMMKNCAMAVPGASVSTSDTAAGIAIDITTPADNVFELRRRAEQMAAMYTEKSAKEAMLNDHKVAAAVTYEPIENGARLTVIPNDPAKLIELRRQVRAHVEQMKKGGCA